MILRPGDYAWLALGAGVFLWEAVAPPEELLSEACDRYLLNHKLITTGVVLYTAAHLVNWLPNSVDLFYRAAVWAGKTKKVL